jgi:hypothetical protein
MSCTRGAGVLHYLHYRGLVFLSDRSDKVFRKVDPPLATSGDGILLTLDHP